MAQLTRHLPALCDVTQFFGGQFFGTTSLPIGVNMTDKTIAITGANSGIGFEAAKHLALLGCARLILVCRTASKGGDAREAIIAATSCQHTTILDVWECNLDSYASVLAFNARMRTLKRLDGFIANAGLELVSYEEVEGLERSLAVNVVSTCLQVLGVLPILRATSERHGVDTVCTMVGSMVHAFGPDHSLEVPEGHDVLETLSDPKSADMSARYPLSKLILHLCAHELAEVASAWDNEGGSRVVVNVPNPGWCKTGLFRYKNDPLPVRLMLALWGRTAEDGSRTLVHAVTAGRESHGKYLSECQLKPESQFVQSERGKRIQDRIWREVLSRIKSIDQETATFAQRVN